MGFIEFIGVSKSFGDRKVISDALFLVKKAKELGQAGAIAIPALPELQQQESQAQ